MYRQVKQLVRRHRKKKKWPPQNKTKHLPCQQKIDLRHESPHLRPSQAIAAISIEFRIDWCIIQVQQLVRRHRKNKKARRQHRQNHLPIALRNRVATSTPTQCYCRHLHQIPERLMYNTGAAMGEKTSKEQRVNATTQTWQLTRTQKSS